MKKKFIAAVVLAADFLAGTGFQKRTDVVLRDYSVPEDETAIRLVRAACVVYGIWDISEDLRTRAAARGRIT